MSWTERGECRNHPELNWFPTGDHRTPGYKQRLRELKAICATCPVITECREASKDEWGVWAGMDDRERGVKLSHHRVEIHGTPGGYRMHYKRGEQPCDECRLAHNERQERFRNRNREVAA